MNASKIEAAQLGEFLKEVAPWPPGHYSAMRYYFAFLILLAALATL